MLRDRGRLAFEGSGVYRKLLDDLRPSIRLNFGEAAAYASRSQIARVAIEVWAATNVACLRCASPLLLVPNNTKLLDAVCRERLHEIQIKGVAGIATDSIVAAAYAPIVERLTNGPLPDYLIVSYDRLREIVVLAEYVAETALGPDRVRARRALGPMARRAGWTGSTLDTSGLTREVVVGPSFAPEIVRWPDDVANSRRNFAN